MGNTQPCNVRGSGKFLIVYTTPSDTPNDVESRERASKHAEALAEYLVGRVHSRYEKDYPSLTWNWTTKLFEYCYPSISREPSYMVRVRADADGEDYIYCDFIVPLTYDYKNMREILEAGEYNGFIKLVDDRTHVKRKTEQHSGHTWITEPSGIDTEDKVLRKELDMHCATVYARDDEDYVGDWRVTCPQQSLYKLDEVDEICFGDERTSGRLTALKLGRPIPKTLVSEVSERELHIVKQGRKFPRLTF